MMQIHRRVVQKVSGYFIVLCIFIRNWSNPFIIQVVDSGFRIGHQDWRVRGDQELRLLILDVFVDDLHQSKLSRR